MPFIHSPKPWQLPERLVTSESTFFNRRQFIKGLVGAGIAGAALPLVGCQSGQNADNPVVGVRNLAAMLNEQFRDPGRPLTNEMLAASYNNFYEYGNSKHIWRDAQALQTDPWQVEVSGLVKNPRTYDLDDLLKRFPLEERIYRFRCVEAWAMVVPWLGFPMRLLLEEVEPTSAARFVRFTSYYDPQITKGPTFPPSQFLPWPYTEGLRVEEMANDLAFFAVGIYGHTLPRQHGAPLRMVVPWKYGFKGAKSVVKIEFIDTQPATYWNTINSNEYKFESNVEPDVPHPRWSQAKERLIGPGNKFDWEEVPTLLYNGYGDYVAQLYQRS
ncbi:MULTISPECIES: protein-methionine-sulfoxide reductase catalytic subunit MsrP [unclassified Leptolyngbya]|uniref:protein-methionine-sulfoxide reductase catalytic subunit MsrP n=1 Tax=unclassified Leptolyngbya TaxID=2650499 RepID=UPI001684B6AC|nr:MULTISPECIES: protein-methionine-sulfoxide reductase catalytic subunit MsrP [unclassified Leptolyngbya]MBD1911970.1 protein-methionine-sulfoxide reductase catalytic subunit MsrP [Leptolyngbya sp. FACHB-8]MBD2157094.1 protein-methionine-sulfoxide reductase catalytic subunit MsrP [Leptolyngbya sp. FACHB-16]